MAILTQMRDADGKFLALNSLPSEDVLRDLDELEAFGFLLERHPYLGVAYRGPSPRLCPDQIEWDLGTRHIGRRITVWNRVTSTNDLAADAARSRANDGLVIFAESQDQGRGRRGRPWVAPPGSSILMSVVLFPAGETATPPWLTALGAVAVAEAVTTYTGKPARIKWPNDVRVDGRKIAGILVERKDAAILGIGLNVTLAREDFPEVLRETATSVRILSGTDVDRSDLARSIIQRIDFHYDEGARNGPESLGRAWSDLLEPIGRIIALATTDGEVVGRLVDASLDRGLRIESETGKTSWFRHSDILGIDGERF